HHAAAGGEAVSVGDGRLEHGGVRAGQSAGAAGPADAGVQDLSGMEATASLRPRPTRPGRGRFFRRNRNRSPLMSIELRGVTKRFGEVAAVNRVAFSVKEGELVALLGPSGGGKTTVLRMIAGRDVPTAGDLVI